MSKSRFYPSSKGGIVGVLATALLLWFLCFLRSVAFWATRVEM